MTDPRVPSPTGRGAAGSLDEPRYDSPEETITVVSPAGPEGAPLLPPVHWKCPDCFEPCRCTGEARAAPHYRCGIPKVEMGEWIHVGNPPTADEAILAKFRPRQDTLPFHDRMHGE